MHSAAKGAEPQSTGTTKDDTVLEILEYAIEGSENLPQIEIERAVYPYLGPGKTQEDVEAARAALEKAYSDKGYQTVGVEIPPQQVKDGIVTLKVTEGKVGRLRVRGSRYFDLDEIKAAAPSLAEGTVPNFADVSQDIVALNQMPDRRVTPALRAGTAPGTVDVDLNVQDSFPLHGSIELNNRFSKDTTELRLSASLRYDNLWQLGHSVGLSYSVAPQNTDDGQVYSGNYLARFPSLPWLSLMGYAVKQDSNISTLSSVNVAGRGEIYGARSIFTLPGDSEYFHTISLGVDRKHFSELVTVAGLEAPPTPVTYYPASIAYAGTLQGESGQTQFNAGFTFNLRGLGSDLTEFDNKRFNSTAGFSYLRGDLSHTEDVIYGGQLFGKLQGQLTNDPLLSSEQFSGGGQDTVRGYLESEVLGDNGAVFTFELRSPSISRYVGDDIVNEWRFHLFTDAGRFTVNDPLPEQIARYSLASVGVGTRLQLLEYINFSFDLGLPLIAQDETRKHDPRLHFRLWGQF